MLEEEKDRLLTLTRSLKELNKQAEKQFLDKSTKEGYAVDFFNEVKPFADKVQEIAEEWKNEACAFIEKENPKYLHTKQIIDTYDNLTISAVQAFQAKTRKKRFLQMISSIDYVLEILEKEINIKNIPFRK